MAKNVDRKSVRLKIREARRAVPKHYAQQASYKFSERIAELDVYQTASSVTAFVPFDGEADPLPLMDRAIQEGKLVFVPIIIAKNEPLLFAPWSRDAKTRLNGFGIREPDVPREKMREGKDLELVITPLVAFDDKCNRLGVGGGFYDRSFAFLNSTTTESKTVMVGLAYELQRVKKLNREDWDVPLSGIVTELTTYGMD